jgi:DNA polymerase elongation subunit (family B)
MTNFYTSVVPYGNSLLVRGYRNGIQTKMKANFEPTLFIQTSAQKPSEWKTLDGIPVHPVKFNSIREAREYVDRYKDVQGFTVHGQTQYTYQFISEMWKGDIQYDPELIKVFSIDIETSTEEGFPDIKTANEEILLITVKDNHHKQIVTFGVKAYQNSRTDVKYIQCTNEAHLLKEFIIFWQQNYPDVITGWNINGFDIPYLVNRIKRVLGDNFANKLSPWNMLKEKSFFSHNQSIASYDIVGISSLDYLELYKKFTYQNQESYRLDYIAGVELGSHKLENPYDNFKDFYTLDWQRFVDYNIRDTELVDQLEDKMKLIELLYTLAFESKMNFNDVYSPVRMWDMIIYNYLSEHNIVVPMKEDQGKTEAFEGAYVKDPLIGPHKWIASFDLNSLYPHLIMQYNMSPETLTDIRMDVNVESLLNSQPLDKNKLVDLAVTANGWCYRKDVKGFLPALMEEMYNNRSKFKKKMLKVQQEYEKTKEPKLLKDISRLTNLQMAMKIALNSAYGAVGNKYFRYYDLRIAEGITTSGQLSIRWIANKLNQFMNKTMKTDDKDYVIAIDTDSIYLTLESLVEKTCVGKTTEEKIKYMDTACEKIIQPFIDNGYQELATYTNAYAQKMQMKREVLADKGIWVAKKRYVLNVHNSEGVQYAKPKVKVMGLEMVKSSTPAVVRSKLYESLEVILHEDQQSLYQFVEKFRTEFFKFPVQDIAFPRSVSALKEYMGDPIYRKGTPIHVRGSLLHNHYLKKLHLTKKYEPITNGNKIKFVYLKKHNPFNENVIAFNSELPKEFGLHDFIDYDLQFEKVFLDALQIVIQPLGWHAEEQSNLELFFG